MLDFEAILQVSMLLYTAGGSCHGLLPTEGFILYLCSSFMGCCLTLCCALLPPPHTTRRHCCA
jgi:hypothetical protein